MKKGKVWYIFHRDGDDCSESVDMAVTSIKQIPEYVDEVLVCEVGHVYRRESSWTTVE